MQLKWTSLALYDLKYIRQYIFLDNPLASKKVISQIYEDIKLIQSFPNLGKTGRKLSTRELVVSDLPYIIVYRLKKDEIEIIKIVHTAKQW